MEKTLLLMALSLQGLSLDSAAIVRQYHYVDTASSWFDAQAYCREEFVDLATVANQEDSDRLLKALRGWGGHAWIGLLDDMTKWSWTTQNMSFNNDGDYSNWELEKLNHSISRSKCALLKTSGAWLDLPCWQEHLSVCYDEEHPDTYVLVNASMKWRDAKKFCRASHSELVFVRNGSENERIASLLSAGAWMGLSRLGWRNWSDRSKVRFTNWVEAQPDSEDRRVESCAAVDAATAVWRPDDCHLKRPFICYSIQQTLDVRTLDVRVRLTLQSEADLQDPAVNQQILKQLHVKLAKKISEFQIHWTEKDGQLFHKENDDAAGRVADLSDRCAENIAISQ